MKPGLHRAMGRKDKAEILLLKKKEYRAKKKDKTLRCSQEAKRRTGMKGSRGTLRGKGNRRGTQECNSFDTGKGLGRGEGRCPSVQRVRRGQGSWTATQQEFLKGGERDDMWLQR